MKSCIGCKWAEWHKTKAGNLHRSGNGRCTYKYVPRPIPASMFWLYGNGTPNARGINRREPLEDHCVYYSKE